MVRKKPAEAAAALLNDNLVRRSFLRVAFAGSHGAGERDLGAGLLYYTFARLVHAQVAVCIGSGGGFVPALMAQAQLDLRIMPCMTYLVDAVLPELAFGSPLQSGGWLTSGNDILEKYPQIRSLKMLSVDAAKLFAEHRISIDYLHIDGDHSKAGVLDDLRSYTPLMVPGGIITLHDGALPAVRSAIDQFLREHPAYERLSFLDLGAGTIVLKVPGSPTSFGGSRHRVIIMDEADCQKAESAGEDRIRFERWRYLASDAYQIRYSLAREWIDAPDATVVEIGGYPNSVVHHLVEARRVLAIEPYAPTDYVERIEAAAAAKGIAFTLCRGRLDQVDIAFERLVPYRIIALGLEISDASPSEESYVDSVTALYRALRSATRMAVEWPDAVRTGQLWSALVAQLRCTLARSVQIDLSTDPVAEEYLVRDKRARRNVSFWQGGNPMPDSEAIVELTRAAKDFYASRVRNVEREEPILPLGETVTCTSAGSCTKYLGFGWSRPEGAFTHALGDESDIIFQWSAADAQLLEPDGEVLVSIQLRPIVAQGGNDARRIVIWLNDVELFSGALATPQQLSFVVSTSALRGTKRQMLRIVHRDRVRVSAIRPGSKDERELSVSLVDFCIRLAATS